MLQARLGGFSRGGLRERSACTEEILVDGVSRKCYGDVGLRAAVQ